jgi:MFS family permease
MLEALRYRNFRLLWIGSTVSNVGSWMHIVTQGWLMYELSESAFYLGLVALMRAIPLITVPLVGGVVADRTSRMRILYLTQIGQTIIAAVVATLTVFEWVEPWHILAISFLNAAVLAFENPARQALLPELVESQHLLSANTLSHWSFTGAALIGPTLAAAAVPFIGIGGAFYLNAVSYGAVIIALYLSDVEEGEVALGSAGQNLIEGLRYVLQTPNVLSLIAITAASSLFGRAFNHLMPVFARDLLGLGVTGMSFMYTVTGLGALGTAAALLALRRPLPKGPLALGSGLAFAICLALFAASHSVGFSMFLLFCLGAQQMAYSITVGTLLQTLAPPQLRGRVMSVYVLAWQGLEHVGTLVTGALTSAWGITPVVVVAAALVGAVLISVSVANRELISLR